MYSNFFRKRNLIKKQKDSRSSNIDYNRALWDIYARNWTKENAEVENTLISDQDKTEYIEHLGDEWGDKASVKQVVNDFILPFINSESVVAEIGSGGGRIASIVAPITSSLFCLDISEEMLEIAREKLKSFSNIEYVLTDGKSFDTELFNKFDFVYSFDVFVHLDLHTIWSYFKEIKKIVKGKGFIFLHTTNLSAPEGWLRFEKQSQYKVEGHYFISPEIIRIMAEKANYEIVKESIPDNNFYYNRDYLFILRSRS